MKKRSITEIDTNKILIAPSILAADFSTLGDELDKVTKAGANLIHLDIMDGHFVPNLTIGPPLIKSIRQKNDLIFDAHLMITNPLKYIKAFSDAGCDHITFHIESDDNPKEVIEAIRDCNRTVGICLNPKAPADLILPYLDQVDMVLVMTVEPGFGGQSFMKEMMPKIKYIKSEINKINRPVHIEVDGGIDADTVMPTAEAGGNIIVAGTSIFRNPKGAKKAIEDLKTAQKWL